MNRYRMEITSKLGGATFNAEVEEFALGLEEFFKSLPKKFLHIDQGEDLHLDIKVINLGPILAYGKYEWVRLSDDPGFEHLVLRESRYLLPDEVIPDGWEVLPLGKSLRRREATD